MIGCAPHHHAIKLIKLGHGLGEVFQTAIDADVEIGKFCFQPMHARVIEWWNLAVLLGRQTLQPRLARVNRETCTARPADGSHKFTQGFLFILVINALLLWFVGSLVRGFHVAGFWPAFWGALVISIVSLVAGVLLGNGPRMKVKTRAGGSRKRDGDDGPVIDV